MQVVQEGIGSAGVCPTDVNRDWWEAIILQQLEREVYYHFMATEHLAHRSLCVRSIARNPSHFQSAHHFLSAIAVSFLRRIYFSFHLFDVKMRTENLGIFFLILFYIIYLGIYYNIACFLFIKTPLWHWFLNYLKQYLFM